MSVSERLTVSDLKRVQRSIRNAIRKEKVRQARLAKVFQKNCALQETYALLRSKSDNEVLNATYKYSDTTY
jgi:hypothetical protein